MLEKRAKFREPMAKGLRNLARVLHHADLSASEKGKLLEDLGNSIKNWLPEGGYASYLAYMAYVNSNRTVLPFSGGFLEQPVWVQNDFSMFDSIYNFEYLNLMQHKDTGQRIIRKEE